MQPRRKLSVEEARDYLRPFARAFHTIECEVDAEVLAYGSGGAGAALYDGLRVPSLRIPSTREATFFDGNVWVDGWFENPGELVFVRGNLVARSLYTAGYLVVAGELRCERFLGEDEPYGTCILGDAVIEDAVGSHNHQFSVLGQRRLASLLGDESDGRGTVMRRFVEWGVLRDPNSFMFLDEVTTGLRDWAGTRGELPEHWLATPYRDPDPDLPMTLSSAPSLSPVLAELANWLGDEKVSQRAKLAQLVEDWLPRLRDEDHTSAARLIRRAINSKRLASELAAVLAKLR